MGTDFIFIIVVGDLMVSAGVYDPGTVGVKAAKFSFLP